MLRLPWTQDPTSGTLTKSTSDREAWSSNDPQPANFSLLNQFRKPTDNIKAYVFGTQDARSEWEAGVEGANIIIRKVAFATAAAPVATSAHGLAAGLVYSQETRVVDKTITVYLNGATTPILTYTIPDNDSNLGFNAYGIVSSVDTAVCLSFNRGELIPSVLVRNKILNSISAGRLFASINGDSMREIARGVARESGFVSMVEYLSKVYIADGQKWKIFDPTPLTVSDWVASSGTLPKFYQIVAHFGRIGGYTVDDPQNLYFSALGDPLKHDTGSDDVGHAYALPVARASVAGQVIRCLCEGDQNDLVIGCGSSTWHLQGDPSQGAINLAPLSLSVGASGPTSMFLADIRAVFMHSPSGAHMVASAAANITSSTGLSPVNDLVLTKGIRFDPSRRDDFIITVVRDPLRKVVFVFMSDMTKPASESVHFAYMERIGNYTRDGGGMFPFTLPFRPTAATVWDSKVLIGGDDGYIYNFIADEEATAEDDDAGTPINSYAPWQQVNEPGIENDTILTRLFAQLANWSAPVLCKVWRGQTAEQAYDQTLRALGWQRTLSWGSGSSRAAPGAITQPVRAPCLVVEFGALSGRWGIEAVEFRSEVSQVTSRHTWPLKPAPGAICAFPGAGGVIGSGTGSGGLATGPGPGGTGPSNPTGSGFVGSGILYVSGVPAGISGGKVTEV